MQKHRETVKQSVAASLRRVLLWSWGLLDEIETDAKLETFHDPIAHFI